MKENERNMNKGKKRENQHGQKEKRARPERTELLSWYMMREQDINM